MSDLRETTGITPEAEVIISLRADLVAARAEVERLRESNDRYLLMIAEANDLSSTPEARGYLSGLVEEAAELRDKAAQSAALLVAVEKLLETDETINWPQPHPEILSAAAGARLTLRMWADEINDLKAKVERLKSEAATLRESNKELAAALTVIRDHKVPCEHQWQDQCKAFMNRTAATALAKATEAGAAPTQPKG